MKTDVLKSPVLNKVAKELGKSPAQTALRWGLQMGHSVLPKSTNEVRIRENFEVLGWSIPEEMFDKFSEIEQASKTPQPQSSVNCESMNENYLTYCYWCYFHCAG